MERKKLIIVGAGGLGRIIHDVLSHDAALAEAFVLHGFLDTRADLRLPAEMTCPLIGSPLAYRPQPDEVFIPAVGDPQWRRDLLAPLIAQGAAFHSYTRQASIAARARIGTGVFLTPGAVVSTDCIIGDFSYVDTYVVLGHDVHIGEHCTVGAMSFLAGSVHVGNGVAIHPRATLAKGVTVGHGATIGIGSVVLKDVPPQVTVFGNPARTIYA